MKKRLITLLLGAFIVALSMNAYAAVDTANTPFADVPKTSWAYDAVKKLAQDGLVKGYGDGSYQGDRALNRYEFATVVARLLEKYDDAEAADKQLIDKLSAEFASELNKLGVRLTKVEAKTNTWISGDTRFRFFTNNPQHSSNKLRGSDDFDFRQRINLYGNINDDACWQGQLSSNWANKLGNADDNYGSFATFDILAVTDKNFLGLDSIRLGRTSLDVIGYGLLGKTFDADGALLKKTIGTTLFSVYTGDIKSDNTANLGTGLGDSGVAYQLTTAQLKFKVDQNVDLGLGYYWSDIPGTSTATGTGTLNTNVGSFAGSKGLDISARAQLGKIALLGDFVATTLDRSSGLPSNPKGWVVQLTNGTGPAAKAVYYPAVPFVNKSQPGTDAWLVSYRSIDAGTIPSGAGGFDQTAIAYAGDPFNINTHGTDNVNAIYLAYENVLAKNVIVSLEFQDFKLKNQALTGLPSNNLDNTFVTRLEFFY